MNAPDSCRTMAAGSSVTSGASTERKTNSRSTMMNRIVSQLGLVAGRLRLLLVGDVGGDGAGQVELQAGRRARLGERRREPVDDVRPKGRD